MEKQDDFKLLDMMKFQNAYNLGWRFSRYKESSRMKTVIGNIAKFNKGDTFAEGLLQGFQAGRSKTQEKSSRKNELDIIYNKNQSSEKTKDSELNR